jgi:succinyl-diaminopimelate desuccinylase
MSADPVTIARELIRCRSVTPEEGGALTYLQGLLTQAGFETHRAVFAEPGTATVDNLYARVGKAKPNLLFAGHTDVVPAGNEVSWSHPPFAGELADGKLYGRGAVDMKGGIACFVAAAFDYLGAEGGKPKGSISLLITGDEESVAVNGTVKLLKWAAERGEVFDHCVLGEPSNVEILGDTIKAGRRGSLNGTLIVTGRQGHVAYPERAENPIRGLTTLMTALQTPLDEGSEHFTPSNLEFTSVDVGNATVNLIPGEARARFNIRFNDRHNQTALKATIERRAAAAAAAGRVRYAFEWQPSNADVFVTKPSPFTELAITAIAEVTGRKPRLSTTGGTSDARFIKDYCPVLEFGLVGQTMHQVDESAPVNDLLALTAVYRRIIEKYFA